MFGGLRSLIAQIFLRAWLWKVQIFARGLSRKTRQLSRELQEYETALAEKRAESLQRTQKILANADSETLHAGMACFAAIGANMTRNVSDWMRRLGEACLKLGYQSVGQELIIHAKEEEGHYRWFEDDLSYLVADHTIRFGRTFECA